MLIEAETKVTCDTGKLLEELEKLTDGLSAMPIVMADGALLVKSSIAIAYLVNKVEELSLSYDAVKAENDLLRQKIDTKASHQRIQPRDNSCGE